MDGKKLKMHRCKNKSAKTHFGCLFYDKVINAKKKTISMEWWMRIFAVVPHQNMNKHRYLCLLEVFMAKKISGVIKPSFIEHQKSARENDILMIIRLWKELNPSDPARKEYGDIILSEYYESIYKYVAHLLTWNGRTKSIYFEDALQEACLVFMEMLDSFDEVKNDNPFLYAKRRIQQCVSVVVNKYLYDCKTWESKASINIKRMIQNNPEITEEEISMQLHISKDEVHYIIDRVTNKVTSLDCEENSDANIKDNTFDLHKDILNDIQHQEICKHLDSILSSVEQFILYHMIGMNCEKKTSKEIGAALGLSGEKVYRDYGRILNKIRCDECLIEMLQA